MILISTSFRLTVIFIFYFSIFLDFCVGFNQNN